MRNRDQYRARLKGGIFALLMVFVLWTDPTLAQDPKAEDFQEELPEESGPVREKPAPPIAPPGRPKAPNERPPTERRVEAPVDMEKAEPRLPDREKVRELKEKILDVLTTDTGTNTTNFLRRIQLQNEFRDRRGPGEQNQATLRFDQPILDRGLIRVDVPFLWVDPNIQGQTTSAGIGDLLFRTGFRLVSTPAFKLFAGGDLYFPTASNTLLGRGKYQVGPGVTASIPFPEINTNFFPLIQHYWSVGGDPSRSDVNYTKFELSATIPWTKDWWTTLDPYINVDWTQSGKTAMNLEFEVGRTLGANVRTWARGGGGLWGNSRVPGSYDWIAQVGVRYVW
jgi:hypothetical protein